MNVLALDLYNPKTNSVSSFYNGVIKSQVGNIKSCNLFFFLDKLMDDLSGNINKIEKIIFVDGLGNNTGVRISRAVAEGLSLALGVDENESVAISVFDVMHRYVLEKFTDDGLELDICLIDYGIANNFCFQIFYNDGRIGDICKLTNESFLLNGKNLRLVMESSVYDNLARFLCGFSNLKERFDFLILEASDILLSKYAIKIFIE